MTFRVQVAMRVLKIRVHSLKSGGLGEETIPGDIVSNLKPHLTHKTTNNLLMGWWVEYQDQ